MESKLQGLIDRLEQVVQRAEATQGGSGPVAGKPQASGPVNPMIQFWVSDVISKVKPFKEATAALNVAQVSTAAEQYITLLHGQTALFATMAKHQKPSNLQGFVTKNVEIAQALQKVKQKDFKSPPNHMQAFIDAVSMFDFIFHTDVETLKEVIVDQAGAIDFWGNKILKLEKDLETKWYNSFKDLNQAIKAFILSNMREIINWKGKESADSAGAYFDSIHEACMRGELPAGGAGGAQASSATPAPPQAVAKPPSSSGLAAVYMDQVLSKMKPFLDATEALKIAQVSTGVAQIKELFEENYLILQLQAQHKKPADLMPLIAKRNAHAEACGKVKQKDMKAPQHHMALICDAMNIFGSSMLGNDEDSKEFYKETHNALPFPGNKILKMDKELDTKWVNAFLDICKAHFTFVLANLQAQSEWKGSTEVNLVEALAKGSVASAPAQQV